MNGPIAMNEVNDYAAAYHRYVRSGSHASDDVVADRETYCQAYNALNERLERLAQEILGHEMAIDVAVVTGRAYVDRMLATYGYEAMEFAEARATWHATMYALRQRPFA